MLKGGGRADSTQSACLYRSPYSFMPKCPMLRDQRDSPSQPNLEPVQCQHSTEKQSLQKCKGEETETETPTQQGGNSGTRVPALVQEYPRPRRETAPRRKRTITPRTARVLADYTAQQPIFSAGTDSVALSNECRVSSASVSDSAIGFGGPGPRAAATPVTLFLSRPPIGSTAVRSKRAPCLLCRGSPLPHTEATRQRRQGAALPRTDPSSESASLAQDSDSELPAQRLRPCPCVAGGNALVTAFTLLSLSPGQPHCHGPPSQAAESSNSDHHNISIMGSEGDGWSRDRCLPKLAHTQGKVDPIRVNLVNALPQPEKPQH